MPVVAKKKTTAVVVRSLPIDVHQRLRRRAKEHGVSTEAEIRSILQKAVCDGPKLNPADLLLEFGRKYGPLPFVKDLSPVEAAKFQ